MLVGQHVAGVVPHELDRRRQLVHAANAVAFGSELLAAQDGFGPQEEGHVGLDRVLAGRQPDGAHFNVAFARTGVGAGQADVAGEDRQHGDGTHRLLAVGLTLHAVALRDERRFGRADFTRQTNNRRDRHAGNLRGPARRLGQTVLAVAEDVVLVIARRRGAGR